MTGADDLDLVRESYDRVADNYVHMVDTTGLGDIRTQPWMKAAMDLFADAVGPLGPVLDVGCGPGTAPPTSSKKVWRQRVSICRSG